MAHRLRVAACHAAPIWLAAKETAEKAIRLIREAAKNKANLVVFPETYISAFPVWSAVRPPTENHDFFARMTKASVNADGEEISAIRAAAKESNVLVSIGFSERADRSMATLFNSNMIIGQDGKVIVHHRKLMPTFFEKLTWAPGDGHGLRVADTPCGRLGQLICGENTNPLARYTLMAQGEQVHISTWPAVWPTRKLTDSQMTKTSTGTSKDVDVHQPSGGSTSRNYNNVAANRTRAAAHCFEAKVFGVLCSGYFDSEAASSIATGAQDEEAIKLTLANSQRGATMFLDPTGAPLPGFVVNAGTGKEEQQDLLQNEEGIIYADMDLDDCIEGKQYHDVTGGYQRFDVFKLQVNRTRHRPVVFGEEEVVKARKDNSNDIDFEARQ